MKAPPLKRMKVITIGVLMIVGSYLVIDAVDYVTVLVVGLMSGIVGWM